MRRIRLLAGVGLVKLCRLTPSEYLVLSYNSIYSLMRYLSQSLLSLRATSSELWRKWQNVFRGPFRNRKTRIRLETLALPRVG